jgi:hypothetical protein
MTTTTIKNNMITEIGARKGQNIRNHIWMVNGVICDVLSKGGKSL